MLGKALRLIRTFHDMKQTELAAKLGISKSYLSELEKGTKSPSIETINKYSELFNITPSSILFFAENLDSEAGSSKARAKQIVSSKVLAILEFLEAKRKSNAQED